MDPILGQLALLPFSWSPKGWMPCDGRMLPINQFQALFSLIGTTYGGDGQTTFALPNLKGPANGLQYSIAIVGVYPSRD
jgi:microcystin-dependent protein